MCKSIIQALTLVIFMVSTTATTYAQSAIAFQVSFTNPYAHYVDVEMFISGVKKDKIEIKMPVWTPGSYLIREFSKNVDELSVVNSKNHSLNVEKTSKNTWLITTGKNSEIKVRYRVYAFEVSVRTSFVDASHAFLSPSGIFMYVNGEIKAPATVTINPYKGWTKISTGLEPVKGKLNTFLAENFDVLFDSPFEIGNHEVFEFNASGVNHEVAMYGGGNYNKENLKRDISKIVVEETAVFGVNPNKRYVFIVHNFSSGGGGLEHANSTVLGATRNNYTTEAGYTNFLSLVAHEYFHLWNVKRLRPIALGPFNYDEENYTTNLWIAEGFTSYYDKLILHRAGFYSPDKYLEKLAGSITNLENQPGNRVQSVSESSFDAWIKAYRPNENSRNTTISYYDKGSMIALIMDLEILNATQGKLSLDNLMRSMYDEYYLKQGRGFTDAEFKAMAEKIAGKSFDSLYADHINGTKTIDYSKYLNYAGLTLTDEASGRNDPYLGLGTSLKDGKLMVTEVVSNSSAFKDGINVNDEIVGIDNNRVSELDKIMATKKVGDKIDVLVNRDGILINYKVTLTKNPNFKYKIDQMESPSVSQQNILKKWLNIN